ncbi:ABC transporter ATP-binding protein [Nonomuraea typhae]|uniref:ABC transporter ATP-binding protein n=1 Tax=Nonomuraea typhae TaxID=2603600 RepID=UPI0012F75811|nr:ABC transporter ATP-binding protein [Nonomuraea typhae]
MTAIIVRDLRKTYGGAPAVDGVSFEVAPGETFGLIGRNGAGKTTTVECLIGLRKPDRGTVTVLGIDPANRRELARRVGVQLQDGALPDRIKAGEALKLFASFYPDPADVKALEATWDLGKLRNQAFGDLSGGQRQRLLLALALVGNPELVVLDELTTALDPVARRETWDLVRGMKLAGTTIVLVSHFMDEAEELCDRVAVLRAGKVAAIGPPRELMERAGAQSLEGVL